MRFSGGGLRRFGGGGRLPSDEGWRDETDRECDILKSVVGSLEVPSGSTCAWTASVSVVTVASLGMRC